MSRWLDRPDAAGEIGKIKRRLSDIERKLGKKVTPQRAASGALDGFFRQSANSVSIPVTGGSTTLEFPASDEGSGIETRRFGGGVEWSFDDEKVTLPTGVYLIDAGCYWANSASGVFHTVNPAIIGGFPAGHILGQTNTLPDDGGMQACSGWDMVQVGTGAVYLYVNHSHSAARTVETYHLSIIRIGDE